MYSTSPASLASNAFGWRVPSDRMCGDTAMTCVLAARRVRQAFTGPPDPGNDHAPDAGNVEGAGHILF